MIAKQSREGWFQSRIPAGYRFGTTPALRATPPDSGGETSLSLLNSFTPSMTAPTERLSERESKRSLEGSIRAQLSRDLAEVGSRGKRIDIRQSRRIAIIDMIQNVERIDA